MFAAFQLLQVEMTPHVQLEQRIHSLQALSCVPHKPTKRVPVCIIEVLLVVHVLMQGHEPATLLADTPN
jgi:hypothetical protein